MIGTKIAHYEILEQLGAGGMGVVYRARDTRLERDVAVKALPEALGSDPDRLARLAREARTLASLRHPHIGAIHGLEEVEGRIFLILELVAGETLAETLARGPLGLERVLETAGQIVDGLEAAHEAGIIHRDLKPANVKVDRDGTVKILDFGLAKILPGKDAASSPGSGAAATLTFAETADGVVVGTPPYMSPEQLRGQPLDARADIWAFGCLLFEMLSGERAFPGATASDVTAAVLHEEPPWEALPAGTPPAVRSLLDWCLAKEAKRRLRHVGDARLLLAPSSAAPSISPLGPVAKRPPRRRAYLLLAGVAALGLLAGAAVARLLARSEPELVMHVPMAPPPGLKPSLGYGPSVAISPDGRTIAYVLEWGTTTRLYVKRLEEFEARPITGTAGARTPFFSPDGRWIGFFDEGDRRLKKVSLSGGEPVVVAPADYPWGAAWGHDDTILFSSVYSGLVRVSADAGTPEPVTTAGAFQHAWPTLLPGDRTALFTILGERGSFDEASIAAVPVAGGTPAIVLESAYYPRYLPTGHLLFVQAGKVLAAPFDPRSLEVTLPAVPVLEDVWTSAWTGYADFAVSDTGTLVSVSGGPNRARATLVIVDRNGRTESLLDAPRPYATPRFSPDGQRVAMAIGDDELDVWVVDLQRRSTDRVTSSPSWDAFPVWRPGTESLAFASMRQGVPGIFQQDPRRSVVEPLVVREHPVYPGSWSPDGRLLAYAEDNPETGLDLWVDSVESDSHEPFLRTRSDEGDPQFSPDGRFIAYQSNETGQQLEVYARPYPEGVPATRISTAGGRAPRWGPGGDELFYLVGGKLMVVDLAFSPDLTPASPRELFEGSYGQYYDVAPDGASFVMIREMAEGDPPMRINLTLNWFAELRRSAVAGR